MSEKRGCFKYTMFGCLGLFVIMILFVGGSALMAWNHLNDGAIEEEVLTTVAPRPDTPEVIKSIKETDVPAGTGLVFIHLKQGEFQIKPAQPGEGIRVEAEYHTGMAVLEDHYEVRPDSSWIYGVRYTRKIGGLETLFRSMMGEEDRSKVVVFLPLDKPIQLRVILEEGGAETELGGLWITDADIRYNKGGFTLNFDEPLREPMTALRVKGKMGGFELEGIGNASPAMMDLECSMGGGDIDLGGDWVNDSDIRLKVTAGGMGVRIPKGVITEDAPEGSKLLNKPTEEVGLPVLRFRTEAKFGEIETY